MQVGKDTITAQDSRSTAEQTEELRLEDYVLVSRPSSQNSHRSSSSSRRLSNEKTFNTNPNKRVLSQEEIILEINKSISNYKKAMDVEYDGDGAYGSNHSAATAKTSGRILSLLSNLSKENQFKISETFPNDIMGSIYCQPKGREESFDPTFVAKKVFDSLLRLFPHPDSASFHGGMISGLSVKQIEYIQNIISGVKCEENEEYLSFYRKDSSYPTINKRQKLQEELDRYIK